MGLCIHSLPQRSITLPISCITYRDILTRPVRSTLILRLSASESLPKGLTPIFIFRPDYRRYRTNHSLNFSNSSNPTTWKPWKLLSNSGWHTRYLAFTPHREWIRKRKSFLLPWLYGWRYCVSRQGLFPNFADIYLFSFGFGLKGSSFIFHPKYLKISVGTEVFLKNSTLFYSP